MAGQCTSRGGTGIAGRLRKDEEDETKGRRGMGRPDYDDDKPLNTMSTNPFPPLPANIIHADVKVANIMLSMTDVAMQKLQDMVHTSITDGAKHIADDLIAKADSIFNGRCILGDLGCSVPHREGKFLKYVQSRYYRAPELIMG